MCAKVQVNPRRCTDDAVAIDEYLQNGVSQGLARLSFLQALPTLLPDVKRIRRGVLHPEKGV